VFDAFLQELHCEFAKFLEIMRGQEMEERREEREMCRPFDSEYQHSWLGSEGPRDGSSASDQEERLERYTKVFDSE
jgi:hypothetical protein